MVSYRMVLAGVLPACVAILNARRSPHSLIRQVMRVLKAVGSFPMRESEVLSCTMVPPGRPFPLSYPCRICAVCVCVCACLVCVCVCFFFPFFATALAMTSRTVQRRPHCGWRRGGAHANGWRLAAPTRFAPLQWQHCGRCCSVRSAPAFFPVLARASPLTQIMVVCVGGVRIDCDAANDGGGVFFFFLFSSCVVSPVLPSNRAVAHLLGEDVVDAARAPSHPRGSAASMAATNILPPPSPSHPGSAHTPSYWPGSPGGGGSVPPSASIWSEGGGGAAGYHHTLARTGGGAGAGGAGAGAGVPVGTTPAGADDGVDPSPTRVLRSSSSLSRVRMAASATARSQSAPLHADRVSGYHMGDQATPASRGGGGGASSRGMPPSYRRSGRMERDRAPPKGNVLKNLSKRGYTPAAVPQRQRPATNVSSAAIQASYNYLFDPVFDSGGSNVRVQSWQRDHKAHRRNQGGQLS